MDLSIGGIVAQVTAPVLDAVSLARTGAVDQIASFLRDNPDQRGAIETTLAASGRSGDLSTIVERAGTVLGRTVDRVAETVMRSPNQVSATAGTATAQAAPVVAQVGQTAVGQAVQVAQQAVGQAAQTAQAVGQAAQPAPTAAQTVQSAQAVVARAAERLGAAVDGALVRPALPTGSTVDRLAGGIATPAARPGQAMDALARSAGDSGRPAPIADARALPVGRQASLEGAVPVTGRSAADVLVARSADAIGAAIRDGRLAQMIVVAAKEGRLADLVAEARTTGRLPALVAAARTLDGVIAAFAGKGGLSATELALFARSGLLSPAETRALVSAGVPAPVDIEEPVPTVVPPQDGPPEERLEAAGPAADDVAIAGMADPALARFDAGVIRFASRAAVDIYGVLGPPGGLVIAADAFEGLLRAADGSLAQVERELGLDAGALRDTDTLVAFIERRDLADLRLADEASGPALAGWLPGGDRAGAAAIALADLPPGVWFREMTFGRGAA